MSYSGVSVFGRAVAAAAVVVAVCGVAHGQTIGPSFGTVEFRWRERSTAGYNGSYTLGPGAVAGVDMVPTPDPSAASVMAQDASVVLVLEAKVTPAAGSAGSTLKGLVSVDFGMRTNQSAGGAFSRQNIGGFWPEINPRASAKVNAVNLGFDPATLPNHPSGTPRGMVAPFRGYADYYGPSSNAPAVGLTSANANAIRRAALGANKELFSTSNVDATNPGEYELCGLNAWVPVYIAIYTITDVTTPRDIVFTLEGPSNDFGELPWEYGLRGWRDVANPLNGGLDSWQLLPGFTSAPTFTVHVVPGPGALGLLGAGGCLAIARRRR